MELFLKILTIILSKYTDFTDRRTDDHRVCALCRALRGKNATQSHQQSKNSLAVSISRSLCLVDIAA